MYRQFSIEGKSGKQNGEPEKRIIMTGGKTQENKTEQREEVTNGISFD